MVGMTVSIISVWSESLGGELSKVKSGKVIIKSSNLTIESEKGKVLR